MISAVIIDDEKAGRENLKALLKKYCPQVRVIGEAGNPDEAWELINEFMPQLVFLDIEMPRGSGFDLLARYDPVPFEVIFVTAFDQYAVKAFHFSSCDYLLKPIEITELIAAVNKAAEHIASKKENSRLKNLLYNLKRTDKERKIALPSSTGMLFVKIADIVRCEADGGYTWFHFTNRQKLLVTKNLGEYEALFAGKGFIRVHHHHLIHRIHIAELIKATSPVLKMSDGSSVTVSHRKREELYALINMPEL